MLYGPLMAANSSSVTNDWRGASLAIKPLRAWEITKAYGMGRIANINAPAIHKAAHILRTKAIPHGANLLKTLPLQILDASLNRGIDLLLRVFGTPRHEVEIRATVQGKRIATEGVHDDRVVSICGVLVGEQLAVFPNTDDIGEEEDGTVFVHCFALGLGYVGVVAAIELDHRAGDLASADGK